MKAKLIPVYFESAQDPDFINQINILHELLGGEAELLAPVSLGGTYPQADAVVFPQMLGSAYRRLNEIKAIPLPILVITSEFATMSMWDWEIIRYLREEGVQVTAPYSLEQAQVVCRALALKRELPQTRFLVYQDNPGEGFQPEIFKRFYWWEEECTQRIKDKFGVEIVRKSFKALAETAKAIPDAAAEATWEAWRDRVPVAGITQRQVNSALKIYLAVKQELDQDARIQAAGINCLNESHFSDTTPCLAWNLLYEERKLLWGCEADTVAMLTEHLVHRALGAPVMMTNLYPFLMGQAALKHEHIPNFPGVSFDPENYILSAHCGYLGVLPQSFSLSWTLRSKVLAIVDDNATAIDARMPHGDLTLVKLSPTFQTLSVYEAILEGYAKFPGSHCLNGAVVRVNDGHRLMRELSSHHYIFVQGKQLANLRFAAQILDLEIEAA